MKRILVPLDGSPVAESILSQVRRLLSHEGADLILLRAVFPRYTEMGELVPSAQLIEEASQYLEKELRPLASLGVRVRHIVRTGQPAQTILDVAGEEKVTLVALSTHGRSGLSRWVFGSVTEKVLRASEVPLLIVRDGNREELQGLTIRNILVPIDGSGISRSALPHAAEFARAYDAGICLFHVRDSSQDAEDQLAVAREYLLSVSIPFRTMVERGDPASKILEACDSESVDLLAMATHGRSGITRWVMGSVTEKVLRHARVPLLAVRNAKENPI